MHYYRFHIGDFRAGTVQLTQIERWVYRDLLDVLYDTEKPLPLDIDAVCVTVGARSREHREAVQVVLKAKFERTEDGYTHQRVLTELAAYQSKAQRAKDANRIRWASKTNLKSDTNQKPAKNTGESVPEGFPEFWDAYGKKTGKANAIKVWKRLRPDDQTVEQIVQAAHGVAQNTELKFRKDPERWLKGRHWEDELVERGTGTHGIDPRLL